MRMHPPATRSSLSLALLVVVWVPSFAESADYMQEILADRPAAYWRFEGTQRDKKVTDTANRISGVGYGSLQSADGVPGIGGKSLRFDGSSSFIQVPDQNRFHSESMTVEFWFRSRQPFVQGSHIVFLSKGGRPGDELGRRRLLQRQRGRPADAEEGREEPGYWAILGSSDVSDVDQGRVLGLTSLGDEGGHRLFTSEASQLNDGEWHHVVLSRSEGGEKRLYVDGELSASANDRGQPVANHEPIYIGAANSDSSWFAGDLDEVAIYTKAITPERVAAHYATAMYESRLPKAIARPVDFVRDVRPILKDRCFECHGNEVEEGGLNLSIRSRVSEGGDSVIPLVAGNSAASPLIHFIAGLDDERMMPPDGPPLARDQIVILRSWIDQGATWPDRVAGVDARAEAALEHWAFRPIQRPVPPPVERQEWVANDIDAFVLAELEAAGLHPAEPADVLTFVRRAHFDLTGLPPSPETVLRHLAADEESESQLNRLIEELLRSKHYGERYGRHWLDVVRYSDSAGYELDTYYEHAWKYRDYVIASFNDDKPFDQFIHEQLAADELWPGKESLRHATGLLTIGPYHFESGIFRPEIQEHKWLTDVADTVGSAFVGLTVGCARCHSHKFDPISQKDYFGLHAIFAEATLWDERIGRPPDNSDERRNPQNWIIVNRQLPATVRVLYRGDLKSPGVAVSPSIFRVIAGGGALDENAAKATGRRALLAQWLTSAENPLTARVLANRVWQWHFGAGLVRTPNDFGTQGDPPTHPRLLDFLAGELIANGWSLKHLHQLIMQSNTYRMSSSNGDGQARAIDPNNELLWHFPRQRLQAEAIWDNLHATAGTLNRAQFGPPVVPPVDEAILATKVNSKWNVTEDSTQWSRRGLYVIVRRALKFPFFETFNLNEPSASCARRDSTVVSPQALTLLNNELILQQSRAFAGRLLREGASEGSVSERHIRRAFLLAYARLPTPLELRHTMEFVERLAVDFAEQSAETLPLPLGIDGSVLPAARGAALVELCRALVNANEFIYVD